MTTAPEDWTQNPYVQVEGDFVAGLTLGMAPFGAVGYQALDEADVLTALRGCPTDCCLNFHCNPSTSGVRAPVAAASPPCLGPWRLPGVVAAALLVGRMAHHDEIGDHARRPCLDNAACESG